MNKNLFFIIYGASGSGKSTILTLIKNIKNVSIHQKDTTRPPRKKENINKILELRFKNDLNENDYLLIYKQYGYFYGVRKDLISKAIENKEFHFIIINDIEAIKKFKSKYPNTVIIYIHYDPSEIPNRFKERDTLEFTQREKRIQEQYLDYVNNNTLFDHVVLNLWDIEYSKKQILSILKSYE